MSWPVPFSCACDKPLLRVVLGTEQLQNTGVRALACMRCGATGAVKERTEPIPDDPHDASRVVGLEVVKVTAEQIEWLGAWPRRVGDAEKFLQHANEVFFLPAGTRASDAAALAAEEEKPRTTGTYSERLRAAGFPSAAMPGFDNDAAHHAFWFFVSTHEALTTSDPPFDVVVARASRMFRPASWIYEELLPGDDALIAGIASLVGDADAPKRRIGLGAFDLLRSRLGTPFALPPSIVEAARARLASLDASDARYLRHCISVTDPNAGKALG